MDEEKLNKFKKQCGQVQYTKNEYATRVLYRTVMLRDIKNLKYDWDYNENKTIIIELEPIAKENSFVLLEIHFDHYSRHNLISYALLKDDYSPLISFGRDRNLLESYMYVDKKW